MRQRRYFNFYQLLSIIVLSMLFAVGNGASIVLSQEVVSEKTESALEIKKVPKSTSLSSASTKKSKGDQNPKNISSKKNEIIYLRAPDGTLVPVRADATLEEYLKWKKKQAEQKQNKNPDYSISSVSLAGAVEQDESHATLNAEISIQLNSEDEWIQVALKMQEAVLKENKYTGKGSASFDHFDRTTGYSWWLKGKGTHTLKLSLLVPIRKKAPMRRLQLSLPETAVSHLKLTVPLPEINVKANENSFVKITNPNKKTSVVDSFGLGTRLDLQWQSLLTQKQKLTVLHTNTRLRVVPNTESVLLTATQEIRAFQGSFSDLKVHLPKEWELVDLKGNEYVSHSFIDDHTVSVQIDEKTAGPIELVWTLETPFPENMKSLSLEGFHVDQARRQMGTIEIEKLDGYQVVQTHGQSVHRMNVGGIVDGNRIATAYQFLKQPFQLQLTIQEIDPNYTVVPNYLLHVSQDEIEVDATYKISVHRGALKELKFSWLSRSKSHWSIESISSAGIISSNLIDKKSDKQLMTVPLIERKNGKFEVRLRARKMITAGQKPIPVELPILLASEQLPAKLIIQQADNIEAHFSAEKKTRIVKLNKLKDQDSYQLINSSANEDFSLLADIRVHSQKVTTGTIESLSLKNNKLLIKQHIQYHVQYEKLAQVRLQVPDQMKEKVQFHLEETLLTDVETGLSTGSSSQIRIPLPEPKIGQFEIIASYLIDLPDLKTKPSPLLLPLISSSDAPYKEVRLLAESNSVFELGFDHTKFQKEVSLENINEWVSRQPHRELSVQLMPTEQHVRQQVNIIRGRVQTTFEQTGQEKTRSQFLLEGDLKSLTFRMHPQHLLEACWWNDQQMQVESLGDNLLRIQFPAKKAQQTGLLTIDYHSKIKSNSRFSHSYQLSSVKIIGEEWIGGVIWDVIIPADQHLFLLPQGYSPLFQWSREGFFWRRRTPRGFALQIQLPPNVEAPPMSQEIVYGNRYLFSRLGNPGVMEMSTLNRSLVVLFGAGLSLIAGFILLKIPATRNLLTLLLAAFAVSVVGLWYWEPVQLLIQPALLGLLLAISAALIERLLERKRPGSSLTLSPGSEFLIPTGAGSSIERPPSSPLFGLGSEDPTMVRPAPESLPSSEVGSHS